MDTHTTSPERSGNVLFVAMVGGIVAITGLISTLAVVGGWWFLALTMAVLAATTACIVVMIARRLAETGDAVPTPAPTVAVHAARAPHSRAGATPVSFNRPLAAH